MWVIFLHEFFERPPSPYTNIPQVSHGKILEDGDIPVFLVTFSTQEVLMFRNSLTGEVAVGAPNKVEQCTYAAVITRVQDELEDELTAGWKVIEVRVCLIASFFFHSGTTVERVPSFAISQAAAMCSTVTYSPRFMFGGCISRLETAMADQRSRDLILAIFF